MCDEPVEPDIDAKRAKQEDAGGEKYDPCPTEEPWDNCERGDHMIIALLCLAATFIAILVSVLTGLGLFLR